MIVEHYVTLCLLLHRVAPETLKKNIRGIEAVSNIINNDISTREERFRGQLKAVENRLAVWTNYVDCLSKIQLIISSDEDLKDFEWIYYR